MRRAEDERRTGRNQHNDFHQVTHCASRWASSCPVQRSRLFFLSTRRSTRKRRHLNVATAAAAFRLPLGTAGSGAAKGKCAALSRWRFDDEAVAASSATAPAAHQLSRILQSRNRSCNYSEIHLARQKSLRRTRHNPRLSLRRRPTKKRRNEIKIKLRRRNKKKKRTRDRYQAENKTDNNGRTPIGILEFAPVDQPHAHTCVGQTFTSTQLRPRRISIDFQLGAENVLVWNKLVCLLPAASFIR